MESMKPSYPKLVLAVIFAGYFLWIAFKPMDGSFLDIVDLAIHETGHLLFRPFGEFMMVAGGSIFQIFVPLVFVGYFVWNQKPYSASIVLFWVGQSLINVFIYADDAIRMQLVLTSGMTGSEGSFHDWNHMLSTLGLLKSTPAVAGVIRLFGTLVIVASIVGSIYYSINSVDESDARDF